MRDCLEQGSFLPSRIQQGGYKEGRSKRRETRRHSTTHLKEIIISTDTHLYNIRRPLVLLPGFSFNVESSPPVHPATELSIHLAVLLPFTCSSLLLGCRFCLRCLLLVAVDHHNPDKCAHHGRTQQREDNRDADGPDARGEEIVERMARVDKGLDYISILCEIHTRVERNTIRRVHVV